MKLNRWLKLTSIIICSLFLFFKISYATTVDKIVVFGDSLSDNGNLYSTTSWWSDYIPFVKPFPSSPPYFEGRFSNGKIWPEYLAEMMNLELSDHAYGGSWAESIWNSGFMLPIDLASQIFMYYSKDSYDANNDQHLYIVWIGANDYLQGRSDVEYATTNTINIIQSQIELLITNGAKNIAVLNLPNLGRVPEFVINRPQAAEVVMALSETHNAKLSKMLKNLQERYPDLKIIPVDLNAAFNDMMDHPEKYDVKNPTDICYTGDYQTDNRLMDKRELQAAKKLNIDIADNPSLRNAYGVAKLHEAGYKPCSNPEDYLFWDSVHPTTLVHKHVAKLIYTTLAENGITVSSPQIISASASRQ